MKKHYYVRLVALLFLSFQTSLSLAQTSWKGTISTSWKEKGNWTAGVPTAGTDAILGDANFTGSFQPTVSSSAAAKSLTLGGTKAVTLTVRRSLYVSGNITINSNATVSHAKSAITLTGRWINNGTYSATHNSSSIVFGGLTQFIEGTNATTFRKLTINTGSITTLSRNVNISGAGSLLTVRGTLNPGDTTTTYSVTGSGPAALTVSANGVIRVYAATFAGNYAFGNITLSAGSIVEYADNGNQTISNSLTYSTLRINGSGTKTPAGSLPQLNATSANTGNINVIAGTLDLQGFTANRGTTVAGGTFNVTNLATLKIGGTGSFPINYGTVSMGLTSTVEYSGAAQTIAIQPYGNLTLSSSGGTATKTFPATALTIAGNFSSTPGAGSAVNYTAAAALTIYGNVNIGASTTFNGSSFTHQVGGNWVNNGTFTGGTGQIMLTGDNTSISGTGTQNFNDLTIAAGNITMAAASNITVLGNLSTSGAGTFTHTSGGAGIITLSGTAKTIAGTNIRLNHLTVTGTITSASSIEIQGTLNVPLNASFTTTAGTITMSGTSQSISGTGTKSFYGLLITGSVSSAVNQTITSSLNVPGSFTTTAGTTTFTGSAVLNGTANLFNVTLNGTSLQLSSNAVLGVASALNITSGTLNVTSTPPNTVHFNGAGAQSINSGTYHHLAVSNAGVKTAAGAITTNGDVSIAATGTLAGSTFSHSIGGNWINNGVYTPGTGTISFTGSQTSTISGTTTFNALTINKTAASTEVLLNSDITAATVNMLNGQVQTITQLLTITSNRTGPGIILGNIRRLHAFATGVGYAFESPDNTITFSGALAGVASVTVSVTQGSVATFPFGGAVNRQYAISIAGTYTAALRLHYEDQELNGNNESSMGIWDHDGSNWINVGKASNNTTTNYVEQTGISNLNGNWTISDNASVVRWNGSVSSNWNTAGNWTSVQGAPSLPPGAGDIVEIGTAAFTNQPAITSNVAVKNIVFGSTQAATLTLGAGGSLTTSGNISGNWSANATHTINAGAQTLTVNGDLMLSNGTAGRAIDLQIGTGNVVVGGSLVQSGGANIAFSGNGTISIGNDFAHTNGSFTAGTGTVIYNGSNPQTVAGVTYQHLSINKASGAASINVPPSVAGNLLVSNGTFNVLANTVVTGSVTIAPGGVLNGDGATISVGGNWSNSGTFNPGNGTVQYNGSGAQSISASTFNNIIISKPSGTLALAGNIGVNSNITVNQGQVNMGSFTANRSAAGGTFTLADGTVLEVGGANNFPANFAVYNLGTTSTVNFNGTAAQTIPGISYGNLIATNGGGNAKAITGNTTVNGNLIIESAASLNSGSFSIALAGNWINNGNFIPATGTLQLNGANKTLTGNTTFNRVVVNGSYSVSSYDMTFNGLLNITSTGSYTAGSGHATVNGDLTNSGSLTSIGVTTFTGTSVQTIRFINAITGTSTGVINFNGNVAPILNSTTAPNYAILNINNTAGIRPSVGWNIFGTFTVGSGASFHGGIYTHSVRGSLTNNGTITTTGTLDFNPSTPVTLQFGSAFSSTGRVLFSGAGAITISGTPTSLQDVVISNTNPAGITPPTGWTVNRLFSISSNAIFNAGSSTFTVGGDIESNGTLNGGTSTFVMTSPAGLISASAQTHFNHLTINGSATANTDFQVDGNFTNNGTYDGTLGTLVMTGNGTATITGTTSPSPIGHLTINKSNSATVTLARNITTVEDLHVQAGILDAATFTISQISSNDGDLSVDDSAVLKIGGTNTLPNFLDYALDTFSTVDYTGSTQSIAAVTSYGNLTLSGAGTKTPAAALAIKNNFTLSNATFTGGAFTHNIGGDWLMNSGSFNNAGTTIALNGTDSQYIQSTGAFLHLTVNKPAGIATLSSNNTVNGNLNFTSGKLSLRNFNLTLGPSGTIVGASATNYVVATGTGSLIQQVLSNGNKVFPVGSDTAYAPATVALASGSTTDNFQVSLLPGLYQGGTTGTPITSGAVKYTWLINEVAAGGSIATITLQWPQTLELPGFNRTATRLSHYINGAWDNGTVNIPATGTNPYQVSRSGFTSFSPFIVASDLSPLPVEWLWFKGMAQEDGNYLTWSVAEETNNAYFAVEASTDGRDFHEIGRIEGRNNANLREDYEYLHKNVTAVVTWYRIRQVDKDGQYSFSEVIRLTSNAAWVNSVIFRNPVTNQLRLSIQSAAAKPVYLEILSIDGKLIYRRAHSLNMGSNTININLAGHAKGIYSLKVRDDQGKTKAYQFLKN